MILLTEALSVFFALKKQQFPFIQVMSKLKLKKKKQYLHLLPLFHLTIPSMSYCFLIDRSDKELVEHICGTTFTTLLRPFGKSWFHRYPSNRLVCGTYRGLSINMM